MTPPSMDTKEARNLLLYLETCAVDARGRADETRMNSEDIDLAKRWELARFIRFGRICFADGGKGNLWVELTDEAHTMAAELRVARAKRGFAALRSYRTTEEFRMDRPSPASKEGKG